MPIKLVAIDLDGTLLTSEKQVHPRNVEAIAAATEAGMRVMLASGRLSTSVIKYAEPLGLPGPHICCNGADVAMTSGEVLSHIELATAEVVKVVDFAQANGIQINVYLQDQVMFLERTEWTDWYLKRVPHLNPNFVNREAVLSASVSKVLLMDSPERIPGYRRELEAMLDPVFSRVTESEPQYLEILPPGVSKGAALERIAAGLGIAQSEVAAIGDYLNDFEMVEWAGFGGAMGDAAPSLKTIANLVVGTNDEGGVAEFLAAALALR